MARRRDDSPKGESGIISFRVTGAAQTKAHRRLEAPSIREATGQWLIEDQGVWPSTTILPSEMVM